MAISVTISGTGVTADIRTFSDATGFHIDEPGRLHVTKAAHGNIATFHPGAWLYAEKLPEPAVEIKVAPGVDVEAIARNVARMGIIP